jgi:hypothetical protein
MRLVDFLETPTTSTFFAFYIVFANDFLQKNAENSWKLKK